MDLRNDCSTGAKSVHFQTRLKLLIIIPHKSNYRMESTAWRSIFNGFDKGNGVLLEPNHFMQDLPRKTS